MLKKLNDQLDRVNNKNENGDLKKFRLDDYIDYH